MKREELEQKIVDASDGLLNTDQLMKLEDELRNYPNLYDDYKAIMNLPDLSELYPKESFDSRYESSIQRIKQGIRDLSNESESFEVITVNWFRRYALAASIAIFAVTSAFSLFQSQSLDSDYEIAAEEFFYPADETISGNYVLYLEEIAED